MLYTCRKCGDICDPGELTNWVCDYCRQKEARETAKRAALEAAMDMRGIQMSIMDFAKCPPRTLK